MKTLLLATFGLLSFSFVSLLQAAPQVTAVSPAAQIVEAAEADFGSRYINFEVQATGQGPITYQWFARTRFGVWVFEFPVANGPRYQRLVPQYDPPTVKWGYPFPGTAYPYTDTTEFRVVVRDDTGAISVGPFTVTIVAPGNLPTISPAQ